MYKYKYNKYKSKYLKLKNSQIGGGINELNDKSLTKEEIHKLNLDFNGIIRLIKSSRDKYNLKFPSIKDSWSEFQDNNNNGWVLFNLREILVDWLIKQIHISLMRIKPEFIENIVLQNFGSKKVTSDIDVNALPIIDFKKLLTTVYSETNLYSYHNFLMELISVYRKLIINAEELIRPFIDNNDKNFIVTSKVLDVNFYPIGPFFYIKNWNNLVLNNNKIELSGIAINNNNIACYVPILINDEVINKFIETEINKSVKNGIILKPNKTDIDDYYKSYIGTISRGEDCYKNKIGGTANCIKKLIEMIPNFKYTTIYAQEWNDILCCIIGTNKYGSELYFTISSIIYVVFYMQMCKENNNIYLPINMTTLKVIALPTCIEQLCFFILHHRKQKYMDRAKSAYKLIDNKYREILIQTCESNANLTDAYNVMIT